MNPVLIYTDTNRIANEKAVLTKVVTLFQNVYNALAAINVTPTIAEINNLVSWTKQNNNRGNWLQDYAVNKIVDAAGPLEVAGITLDRAKFIQLMNALPDVSGVKTALNTVGSTFNGLVNAARTNLLSLANGVISKVGDSDTQIETEFTYYTKTDASATIANGLQAVCDALNTFNAANPGILKSPVNNAISDYTPAGNLPAAITDMYGTFVISLAFIRGYEAKIAA